MVCDGRRIQWRDLAEIEKMEDGGGRNGNKGRNG